MAREKRVDGNRLFYHYLQKDLLESDIWLPGGNVASHSALAPRFAILAPVGEIDPSGARRDSLDDFLDQKVKEGYVIETRTDTHAIISRRPKGFRRFRSGADPGRYVVEVDEAGLATMRPAEPRRT